MGAHGDQWAFNADSGYSAPVFGLNRLSMHMDSNSPGPPSLEIRRRKRITTLGIVAMALAALCLFGATFRALTGKWDIGTDSGLQTAMFIHNTLVVLSKIGLLVLGICLIRRHPRIRVVAACAFTLSLIDSVYFLIAIVPSMRASFDPALKGAFTLGVRLVLILPALLYVGIIFYLGQPAARQEFRRIEA
jgi:hypothetical protein